MDHTNSMRKLPVLREQLDSSLIEQLEHVHEVAR